MYSLEKRLDNEYESVDALSQHRIDAGIARLSRPKLNELQRRT